MSLEHALYPAVIREAAAARAGRGSRPGRHHDDGLRRQQRAAGERPHLRQGTVRTRRPAHRRAGLPRAGTRDSSWSPVVSGRRAGQAGRDGAQDFRLRARRSSPANGARSISSSNFPASRPRRAFSSRPSRARSARSSTPARPCPACARCRNTPSSAAAGRNHRFGLYDMFLIKDNHLALMGARLEAWPTPSAPRARSSPKPRVEVEVDRVDQIPAVLAQNVDQDPPRQHDARRHARGRRPHRRSRAKTEASGNMTLDRVARRRQDRRRFHLRRRADPQACGRSTSAWNSQQRKQSPPSS